jgi:hypothetical protein
VNWYVTLKLAMMPKVANEYWIHDGQASYADGDVGDVNHEGMVIDSILAEHDLEGADLMTHQGCVAFVRDWVWDHAQEAVQLLESKGVIPPGTQVQQDDVEQYADKLTAEDVLAAIGLSANQIGVLFNRTDGRDYALEVWGWKRMIGNSVQTWELDAKDLGDIGDGIYDAMGDQGEDDDGEDEQRLFNIEVMNPPATYQDVPLTVILSGDLNALQPYNSANQFRAAPDKRYRQQKSDYYGREGD